MRLETQRLLLRPLVRTDATETYASWLNDPQVNRFLETRHVPQTIESCASFIERTNQDPQSHLFGVYLNENSVHIGNAKLGFINPIHKTGELSLFIGDRDCWGKGFAREIIRVLTEHAFHRLGLERVEAGCYEENVASVNAFVKEGYTVEGYFRESVVFEGRRSGSFWLAILKNEYK